MAEKKIGAKIVIDGESEFRSNLNSAKKALSNFESELKLVSSQYKNSANSLEALSAKQSVYIKLQEEQKNKIKLLSDMQEKAIEKYKSEQTSLENANKSRENLANQLEEAKKKYGENSQEVEELSKQLEESNKACKNQENALQKLGDKISGYSKELNDAQTDLNNLDTEVQKNEKYLKEAESSFDGCATSIDEYGNEVEDAKEKTSVFGDVLKAELAAEAIKAGITTLCEGIKSIATAAVESGSSFEAAMSQVAATMGMKADEIKNGSNEYKILEKAAQDCGKSTMYSASQAAEALNYLALAGYNAEKSAEVLPKVLNLAAAGGLDLAYASDLVTDSMAALGLETEELDNYIDEMAKTSQKSNTSVAQLGEATLVCAGTVKLAGQSLETMNTALGVMANNGIKGAEGGTHLRNILLSLSTPTSKAAVAIESLGLNITDSAGNMRDLESILIDLNSSLSDLSADEKSKKISAIFNKTDISAVNALLKGTNGEFKTLNSEIRDCSGAAAKMAETMNDNLKGKITILGSAMEGLQITAYNLFDDTMKNAVDSATNAVVRLQDSIDNGDLGVSLSNMSEALGQFCEGAIGVGEDALPKLIDGFTWLLENADLVATLIGGVTAAKIAYTTAVKIATVAQELFNITANANPYILLATAIGGVAAAIGIYCATADEVSDYTEEVEKLVESSEKLNKETKNASKNRAESKISMEAEEKTLKKLVAELEILESKTSRTASEESRMKAIIEQLNQAMPELNLYIDEQSGKLSISTDEIYKNIEASLLMMKTEAAREDLTEIAKEQYEAEKKLAELKDQETEALQRFNEAALELKRQEAGSGDSGTFRYTEEAQKAYTQATMDLEVLREKIGETNTTIDSLGTEYESTMQYIADNEAATEAANAIEGLGDAASECGSDIAGMSEETQAAFEEMYEGLTETIEKQMNLFEEFKTSSEVSTGDILKNMESQVTGVQNWSDNLKTLGEKGISQGLLKYLAEMGPQGASYVQAFVQMTTEEIEKANDLFAQSLSIPSDVTQEIIDSYVEAGKNSALGMQQGIEEETENTVEKGKVLAKDTLDALKAEMQIQSPSKMTEEIGQYFDEGLAIGIEDDTKTVLQAIQKLATQTIEETKKNFQESSFKTYGTMITEGLSKGIKEGKSGVINAIIDVCKATVDAAKKELDIHSPSKKFEFMGEMSGEGWIEGWQVSMSDVGDVIHDSFDLEAFENEIEKTSSSIGNLGMEYETTMGFLAGVPYTEDIVSEINNIGEAAIGCTEDMDEMSEETKKSMEEMYKGLSDNISKQINLFEEFKTTSEKTPEAILKNMESQVVGVQNWSDNLKALGEKGISQGLLKYLAEMGPQGASYVQAFVDMTSEEIGKANELYAVSLALPDAVSQEIMASYYEAGRNSALGMQMGIIEESLPVAEAGRELADQTVEALKEQMQIHSPSEITKEIGQFFDQGLSTGIEEDTKTVLQTVQKLATQVIEETKKSFNESTFRSIGSMITSGLSKGIQDGKSGVINAIIDVCKATVDAAKKELDVHSPSKKFEWMGEMSGQGWINGWQQTMSDVKGIIQDTFIDIQQPVQPGYAGEVKESEKTMEINQNINIYSTQDDLMETARKFRESQREAAEAW